MNRGGVKRTMRGNVREAEVFFNIAQRRKKSISPGKKHGKQFVFAVRTFSGKQARKNALSPDDPAPRKIEACQPAQREGRLRNPEEMTAEKNGNLRGEDILTALTGCGTGIRGRDPARLSFNAATGACGRRPPNGRRFQLPENKAATADRENEASRSVSATGRFRFAFVCGKPCRISLRC